MRWFALTAVTTGLVCSALFSTQANAQSPVNMDAPLRDQARRLLAPVLPAGNTGPDLLFPSQPLDALLSAPEKVVSLETISAYLAAKGIDPAEVQMAAPTSLPALRYFVIHDTSSPYLGDAPFPPDINDANYRGNNLANLQKVMVTHDFINRVGRSVVVYDYGRPVVATKYEKLSPPDIRTHFVHNELVQPRHSSPAGAPGNDIVAPIPGFTDGQYDRLALLYTIASARHGGWLIPAFHCNIDKYIRGGHDDPQHFEMDKWMGSLQTLLTALKATVPLPAGPVVPTPVAVPYQPPAASLARLGTIPITQAKPIDKKYAHLKALLRLPSGALYIDAGLQTDADGSPRAKEIDIDGQTQTSLAYRGYSGQQQYIDAEKVPFFVLPTSSYKELGAHLGDVAAVIYGDKVEYAIFADTGPNTKIGEGSVKLVESLGHNPWNKAHEKIVSGIDSDVIVIVFPGTADASITPETVNDFTVKTASALFKTIGGVPN